jgi:hypothetical protein
MKRAEPKFELTVRNLTRHPAEPMFWVEVKNPTTGEVREVQNTSLESCFRTLGRSYDKDLKKGLAL